MTHLMLRLASSSLALLLMLGCDDSRPPPTDGAVGVDAGTRTDGGASDAAVGTDAGTVGTDGGGGGTDAGPVFADVGLTFSGCSPDFSGRLVVVANSESVAVSATTGSFSSIQLALEDALGNVDLSTQHRVDTGSVINVVVAASWTNIAMDSAGVLSGGVTDPIGGSLTLRAYDEASGVVDVQFNAVTLQNPGDGTICQIDGRLQTFGLSS